MLLFPVRMSGRIVLTLSSVRQRLNDDQLCDKNTDLYRVQVSFHFFDPTGFGGNGQVRTDGSK